MSSAGSPTGQHIFTIGHSNHPSETFISLLKAHGIQVLVDIRSQPHSKYALQFDKHQLEASLEIAGIKYLYLGKELGGRPAGAEYYDAEGYVLYSRLARSPLFLEGIARLRNGIQGYRVALMCSEEDPHECHRHLLIGRVLSEKGIEVSHIRGDGGVQTEDDLAREEASRGRDYVQGDLFLQVSEEDLWKSTQSVLPKEAPPTSSEH